MKIFSVPHYRHGAAAYTANTRQKISMRYSVFYSSFVSLCLHLVCWSTGTVFICRLPSRTTSNNNPTNTKLRILCPDAICHHLCLLQLQRFFHRNIFTHPIPHTHPFDQRPAHPRPIPAEKLLNEKYAFCSLLCRLYRCRHKGLLLFSFHQYNGLPLRLPRFNSTQISHAANSVLFI